MNFKPRSIAILVPIIALQACTQSDRHPIIGTWEGNSIDGFPSTYAIVKFDENGTYSWKEISIGLREILKKKHPEIKFDDFDSDTTGTYTIEANKLVLTPKTYYRYEGSVRSEGRPVNYLHVEGHLGFGHYYYFENSDLVISGSLVGLIKFKRKCILMNILCCPSSLQVNSQ